MSVGFSGTAKPVSQRIGIEVDDLITPTDTQKYPLGLEVEIEPSDSLPLKVFKYIKATGALIQFQPFQLSYSNVDDEEVTQQAPATIVSGATLVVPQVAFTSGQYGFVQIQGDAQVNQSNETFALGDFLEVINAGTETVVDGTSGATTLSTKSFAISKTAGSSAATIAATLLGRSVEIAAA